MSHSFLLFVCFALLTVTNASRRSQQNFCNGYRANPSVYNFKLGGRTAKVISDGRLLFEVTDTYKEPAQLVQRALKLNSQSFSPIIFENNILYIDLGKRKVLFDTGNSYLRPEVAGFLFKNLNAEGINRWSITDIFINHAHFDHIAGLLLPDGRTPAFPRAVVHINRKEWMFWLAKDVQIGKLDVDAASRKFLVDTAKFVFGRIKKQVRLFDDKAKFFGGLVTAMETSWHTPGHTSYMLNINKEKLLYAGDAIGIESTAVNNPWFRLRFDLEKDAGAVGRVMLLDSLAKSGIPLIAYHASFPGFGRIVTNDLTFDWKPVNWEFSEGVKTRCPAL
eukprot:IDg9895t1